MLLYKSTPISFSSTQSTHISFSVSNTPYKSTHISFSVSKLPYKSTPFSSTQVLTYPSLSPMLLSSKGIWNQSRLTRTAMSKVWIVFSLDRMTCLDCLKVRMVNTSSCQYHGVGHLRRPVHWDDNVISLATPTFTSSSWLPAVWLWLPILLLTVEIRRPPIITTVVEDFRLYRSLLWTPKVLLSECFHHINRFLQLLSTEIRQRTKVNTPRMEVKDWLPGLPQTVNMALSVVG